LNAAHDNNNESGKAGDAGGDFSVKFWGVRGSIACGGPDTIKYGGNTASLEVRCGDHVLLLDAGTGIRYAGNILADTGPRDLDIFLTHTHFDHVCGLPFFAPLFYDDFRVTLWAGHLAANPKDLVDIIRKLMEEPLFPVPPDIFQADVDFRDFESGDVLKPRPGVTVRTAPLKHPNEATGYRVEYGGKSICYVSDTEHRKGELNDNILGLIDGTDIFIYDSMYTEEEHAQRIGWGHSTWQEGVRLADAAGVGTFVAFHHDPDHDDDFMDRIAADVEKARPGSVVAREGLVLTP
jgi:phosphoribosyl 1,2-cyclic phosphodiesterase